MRYAPVSPGAAELMPTEYSPVVSGVKIICEWVPMSGPLSLVASWLFSLSNK